MHQQFPESEEIEKSVFRYILRHTVRQQGFLIALTLISMPFVYFSLEVPKLIINEAIGGAAPTFQLLGYELIRVQYLLALSGIFLLLVILNGVLKYFINVYRGVLGERMLQRIRNTLYGRLLRFSYGHSRKVSSGEVIPMLTAETEPLGGFIGDSIALPVFQGGLLVTYVSFIFVQDFWLGLAAIALYPPQMYLIPKLQKRVNALSRERIQSVRSLSGKIGETVDGLADIRLNDTGAYERSEIDHRLARIFDIRNRIFRRKFFIKFLNNFLAQLTPFFFYSIGGYLVITGDLSLGALVAVLAAYKDIGPPWKELLKFYQITEDIRVKYTQIVEQFDPPDLVRADRHLNVPEEFDDYRDTLQVRNASRESEHHSGRVRNVALELAIPQHVALLSSNPEIGNELALMLAGIDPPSSGKVEVDQRNLFEQPESLNGRNIAMCARSSFVFGRTVRDNLLYGLMHREQHSAGVGTNALSWVDLEQAGVAGRDELSARLGEVLDVVELRDDVVSLALDSTLDESRSDDLPRRIVAARASVQSMLDEMQEQGVVEPFDRDRYSDDLTIAENLLFGTPKSGIGHVEELMERVAVQRVIEEVGLRDDLVRIGREIAALMLELFKDVDEDSDLMARYSFIPADQFEQYRQFLSDTREVGPEKIPDQIGRNFSALALRYCPAQHRLDLLPDNVAEKILTARHRIMERLGADNDDIQFIERDAYQYGFTVKENLLFGRVVFSKRHLEPRVNELIREGIQAMGIGEVLLEHGLDQPCGTAGARLTESFRARLALARGLMKNPDVFIVNDVLAGLDRGTQLRLLHNVKRFRAGKNLIWTLLDRELEREFDRVIEIADARRTV